MAPGLSSGRIRIGAALAAAGIELGLAALLVAGLAVSLSAPRGGGTGAAPAPTDPDAPPWTTDANGVLAVDGLPSAPLDLYLHRDGYQDEVLGDVRPGEATWFATLVR